MVVWYVVIWYVVIWYVVIRYTVVLGESGIIPRHDEPPFSILKQLDIQAAAFPL